MCREGDHSEAGQNWSGSHHLRFALTERREEAHHYDADLFNYDPVLRFVYYYVFCASSSTGKERDTESGNDYFGARYYASSMGRFSSPDPSGLVSADPSNPQSFNLYNYVLNNPLVSVDPNGLDCIYAQDNNGPLIKQGDCTNAGGQDDDGLYVNGAVYSATQDDNGNVTSYNTLTGSFLPDGTSNSFTVTAVDDPGVVGAPPLEPSQITQEIDPSLALATGVMNFGIPKLCAIGITATFRNNSVTLSSSGLGTGAGFNKHTVGTVTPQNAGTGSKTLPIGGPNGTVPFSAHYDSKGPPERHHIGERGWQDQEDRCHRVRERRHLYAEHQ